MSSRFPLRRALAALAPLPSLLAALAFAPPAVGATYRAAPDVWHQLVWPVPAGARTVGELFAGALPARDYGTTWALFGFRASDQSYAEVALDATLPEGQAFWFVQSTGRTVTLDTRDAPFATGRDSAACDGHAGCSESALGGPAQAEGWNLVGHPFEAPVNADALRVATRATGTGCRRGCALEASAAMDLVGGRLWRFEPGSERYVDLAARRVDPWLGFWVALRPGGATARPSLLFPDPFCA